MDTPEERKAKIAAMVAVIKATTPNIFAHINWEVFGPIARRAIEESERFQRFLRSP